MTECYRLAPKDLCSKPAFFHLTCKWKSWIFSTGMSSETEGRLQILQGMLDLMVLQTLRTMGPLHAYGIAARLQQLSGDSLSLNQGTLYPALVRLEQQGLIKGAWRTTENNREAKYYAVSNAGEKALEQETQRWQRLTGLMDRLLWERP